MNLGSNIPASGSSKPGSHNSAEASGESVTGVSPENTVLNDIVRASGLGSQRELDQGLIRAEFLKVAKAYQHSEFSVDPVLTSLVQVALGELKGVDEATAVQLKLFVANSICENKETYTRVRRFWDSLVKAVQESA
ncbi:MAG: hypothetical protein R3C17_03740 [Planctomycetaceae bacterium]